MLVEGGSTSSLLLEKDPVDEEDFVAVLVGGVKRLQAPV